MNLCIPKEVTKPLVEYLLKMASRGQFSKNKDMRSQSCQVFRQLAYLEPQIVLPLVYNRFHKGLLESVGTVSFLGSQLRSDRPMLQLHSASRLTPSPCASGRCSCMD